MQNLQADLELVLEREPEDFMEFSRDIPREWVNEALLSTESMELRRRRLPAESMVWLAIGIALFRTRSVVNVLDSLGLHRAGLRSVAPSAVSQARARLGPAAMQWLFYRLASEWAHSETRKDCFHGMPLYGLDGVTATLADTVENRAAFGGPSNGSGQCARPVIRAVCLLSLRARLLAGVSFGTYHQSEHRYADELWNHLPEGSLCLFDKGFYSAASVLRLRKQGSHFLCRLPSGVTYEVIRVDDKDDRLVRITLDPKVRAANPELPESFEARLIRIRGVRSGRKSGGTGKKPLPAARQFLLTSLVDRAISADEIRRLYGERWELENTFDEVKTEMLERQETLRSKHPETVEQELWGLFIAYNLVRLEMVRAAEKARVSPVQISFAAAFIIVRDEFIWLANAAPGSIPKQLTRMRDNVAKMVLAPRRRRSYPRVVRAKRTRYPVKNIRKRARRRKKRDDTKSAI